MFQLLCHDIRVHPTFIEVVISFGFKIREGDEYFAPSYVRFGTGQKSLDYGDTLLRFDGWLADEPVEIYYSVQYVELNGRSKPSDPWSFRRYALYQRYDGDSNSSSWISIQLQNASQQWIHGANCNLRSLHALQPLSLHLRFLNTATISWRDYLNYLGTELDLIVSTPHFIYTRLTQRQSESKSCVSLISNQTHHPTRLNLHICSR